VTEGNMLAYSPLYQSLASDAYNGRLQRRCESLQDKYDATPRWRFLRRFHLERQLIVATLAEEIYRVGWGDGVRSTARA